MHGLNAATFLAIAVSLAACAGTPKLSDSERYALYREHAGEPVKSFRYFQNINGWTPLDRTSLVVWTRPGQAYLLETAGPCQDLEFATAITLTNMAGEVSARFDKVIVHGGGQAVRIPCRIEEIRPIDVKSLRRTEREMRQASLAERDGSDAAPVGMANPASVNCAKLGGASIARTAADGSQSADCKLPDGQQCEEWTLYREGKCPAPGATK